NPTLPDGTRSPFAPVRCAQHAVTWVQDPPRPVRNPPASPLATFVLPAGYCMAPHREDIRQWRAGRSKTPGRRKVSRMSPYRIPPTRPDIAIADAVAAYTSPRTERAAELLTWGADEHILLAMAAGWWLYCRGRSPRDRSNSDHILLTTLAVSVA